MPDQLERRDAMGATLASRFVPDDGQCGNPLAEPLRSGPDLRPVPKRVATVGVEPGSYLRRGILWTAFGVPNVRPSEKQIAEAKPVDAQAIIIQNMSNPPAWDKLLAWVGRRSAVVDIALAAQMAQAAGHDLRVGSVFQPKKPSIGVLYNREEQAVYPKAPAVEIIEQPPVPTGFAVGDRFHFYSAAPRVLGLRVLEHGDALQAFAERFGATAWGKEASSGAAAVLSCPTPDGGLVTVMDLNAVDRQPEPSGSEIPGMHLMLSLLGRARVDFGKFVVPHAKYDDYVAAVRGMVERFDRFASMEKFGRTSEGKDMWLVKIAPRVDATLPVVLFSNTIHPYEWGPVYGLFRYLFYMLHQLEAESWEARELLADRQVWWVLSACPDGWETRNQQQSAVNLNRNFPGTWELVAPGNISWGRFGAANTVEQVNPVSLRGPAPASEPETRALMSLLHRDDGKIVTHIDYHETTAFENFLHQPERNDGSIDDSDYHVELLEGICDTFSGRYFEQRDAAFRMVDHERGFVPGMECAWLRYACDHGAKGVIVEAIGGDCTHYRTIRRTEYGANVAEQTLANELGRLYRNPWGESRQVTLHLERRPTQVTCRIYNAAGELVHTSQETNPAAITREVPDGGCLRLRFEG